MARARSGPLDSALESWARWVDRGGFAAPAGRSMLAQLIDGKGEILFHNKGGSREPLEARELRIEGVVLRLAEASLLRADVLRLECGAGAWAVCKRRGIRGYDFEHDMGQFGRAHALGISLRTYERHLAAARAAIADELGITTP